MKYLLIAEKPSLMRAIRDCYENHKTVVESKVGRIEFTALAGHVCGMDEPDLYPDWKGVPWRNIQYPMVPEKWHSHLRSEKKAIIAKVREGLKDADGIICATDSDVEGYGIYYLLRECMHLENYPTLRFVEHSLTDSEILKSLLSMRDMDSDPTHIHFTESYLVRSRADWLYGFNLSRLLTLSTGVKMAVGRVKAPTVRLVYDRCNEIDNFQKQTHYEIEASYVSGEAGFKGRLYDPETKKNARFESRDLCPKGIRHDGTVMEVSRKKKKISKQKLYDLSALQAAAGRSFGYSPKRTLELAQNLYEKYKVLSYPRTQCRYVSKARAREFPMMLEACLMFPEFAQYKDKFDVSLADRPSVVNDAEVNKESHDALLPTGVKLDPATLPTPERNVYTLVVKRLLEQFLPDGEDEKTDVKILHKGTDGKDYLFTASGNRMVTPGFRILSKEGRKAFLPELNKGDAVHAEKLGPVAVETKPPARYTQATLAEAMENIASKITDDDEAKKSLAESKGIGQPSTRAVIIDELVKFGYVLEKKDGLYISDTGREYAKTVERAGLGIDDPLFAAKLDMDIKAVQRGEAEYVTVYGEAVQQVRDLCRRVEVADRPVQSDVPCPVCGAPMVREKWSYRCGQKNCGTKFTHSICGHVINDNDMKRILAGERLGPYAMKSKKGKEFDAKIYWDAEKTAPGLEFVTVQEETNVPCPECGKPLVKTKWKYKCTAEGGCGKELRRFVCGHEVDETQLESLLAGNREGPFPMQSQAGKHFKAYVVYENGDVGLKFTERKKN